SIPAWRASPEGHATFAEAWRDIWFNLKAIFTPDRADWSDFLIFWNEVIFPWFIGGLIPGTLAGLIAYHLSLPVISAYQTRRAQRRALREQKLRAPLARRAKPE
ncbi:MAG: DUF2062 domain-containing protein, partial [Pseudomonadota bacterium]